MIKRTIATVALFLSVFFLPWWITVLLAIVGILFIQNFYEVVVAGLLIDLLYGTDTSLFFGFSAVFTIGALALVVLGERFKKNIRLYVS